MKKLIPVIFMICFSFFGTAHAQNTNATNMTLGYVVRALVTNVVSNMPTGTLRSIPQGYNETVIARILDGTEKGKTVEFKTSDIIQGSGENMNKGDIIYVDRYVSNDTNPATPSYTYQMIDHYRLPVVIFFIILFLGCTLVIGGKQGLRGLISLLGGICLIAFVLIPGALHGYSPLLLSVIIASLIAGIGGYITHGFSKMTSAAVIGMILTILVATCLASIAVHVGHLSGITDDSTYNLMMDPPYGAIDFQGVLLGGIIIGLLGVLYDAAIGQAVAVEELMRVAPHLSRGIIYSRAARIGREHIGALVNTLVLAYVGTSLPIILALYGMPSITPYGPVLNWEFVAAEIIRTTVGGIGLMLTIPITTLIAVWLLMKNKRIASSETLAAEEYALSHVEHGHSH